MEKRPHRFDLLYESNPKEWDYLMFHMCKDKDGNDYGWAKVLDYIGVGWEPTTIGDNCKGQMSLPLDQMIKKRVHALACTSAFRYSVEFHHLISKLYLLAEVAA